MNCWRFGPAIFEACRRISPSPRGEYEIPDAVEYAMHRLGEPFRAVRVHGAVLDLSSRQDVASIASRLAGVKVDP
jgi:dTDP-glucose pyrophosphorylase